MTVLLNAAEIAVPTRFDHMAVDVGTIVKVDVDGNMSIDLTSHAVANRLLRLIQSGRVEKLLITVVGLEAPGV